jgi:CubicO group peptidase (beta-lactamase class C family)
VTRPRVVAPGFEPVAELFDSLHPDGAPGASFAVLRDGLPLVDLWGGTTADGQAWDADTVCVIASGTKGVVAVAVLVCAERGLLDLDTPIARYWPEFASGGKEMVSVGDALAHLAGVPGLEVPVAWEQFRDPVLMAGLVASQRPIVAFDVPSYHAATYGWIAAELVRRVDGRSMGAFIREEIAGPLAADVHLGASDDVIARWAPTTRSADFNYTALLDPNADPRLAFVYGIVPSDRSRTPDIARIEFPGGGAVATAHGMARIYGMLGAGGTLDGTRILDESSVAEARRQRSYGVDPLAKRELRFGAGFELNPNPSCLGPDPDAFGHTGAGGSTHGAWPSRGVSFSYVMGEYRPETNDGRARPLLAAVDAALGG